MKKANGNGSPPRKTIGPLAAARIDAAVSRIKAYQAQLRESQMGLQTAQGMLVALCKECGLEWGAIQGGDLFIATNGELFTRNEVEHSEKKENL